VRARRSLILGPGVSIRLRSLSGGDLKIAFFAAGARSIIHLHNSLSNELEYPIGQRCDFTGYEGVLARY
jgi:hypothetical protein